MVVVMTRTRGWRNIVSGDTGITRIPQAPMHRVNEKHDALYRGNLSLAAGCTKARMNHATALHSVAIEDEVDSSLHNVEWIETHNLTMIGMSRKGND